MADSFATRAQLDVNGKSYTYFSLPRLGEQFDIKALPYSMKILLENLLRHEDGGITVGKDHIEAVARWNPAAEPDTEIAFMPARVVLQDFTGVPCVVDLAAMRDAVVKLGGKPEQINPLIPSELVIDHSVQVDVFGRPDALDLNAQIEFDRNKERYSFLRWGQKAFDNFKVGVQQAESLVKGLKERFPDQKPWNVELFGGSPDDNNAFFFYDGAMSVLQPMIDAGEITIPSGQSGMDKVGTLRWDPATAQARMDNILSANYGDKQLHGVLSPYDGLSIGILSSVKGVGYGSGDLKMPIVTGQDAEVPSVKSIEAGEQYSTIFKDTRELAKVTVGMVDAVMGGSEPQINDTKTYDNGKLVVPSYLLEPVPVFKDNYKQVLVDSGYYKEDQLK